MRNRVLFSGFLAVALIASTWGTASAQVKTTRVCFKDKCFRVEIADTDEARTRGLMGRSWLARGKGMLFVFPAPDVYSFWMKGVTFPIDIVWLDDDKQIVHIARKVRPCREEPCPLYTPAQAAQYVLEIQSGAADRNDLLLGDKANWQ